MKWNVSAYFFILTLLYPYINMVRKIMGLPEDLRTMGDWKEFITDSGLERKYTGKDVDLQGEYGVYPGSVHISDNCTCFITWDNCEKVLIVAGGSEMDRFEGREEIACGKKVRVCPLNTANSRVIRSIYNFTNPACNKSHDMSIGLGDRLGLASPGHIRLIKDKNIFPILAQQSVRELNLTGRTFADVLSAAVWAVFQEGYEGGYGADGDHLKTAAEVKNALDNDYTMITLDCSEHIHNDVDDLSEESVKEQYAALNGEVRRYWEDKYLDKAFSLGADVCIDIPRIMLMKTVLMYRDVLNFVEDIFSNVIKAYGRDVDFEISIDETSSPTLPGIHYMIASELKDRGVRFMSLAPRFCGEFQKGIDYKGDILRFERELRYHVAISRRFDYKISVHSGSDKFSVFPVIGEVTGHKFHLKTAGTNWLEALGVIAKADTELFLSIYKFALEKLGDAKKYYHISTERDMVPEFGCVAENPIYYVRNNEAVRQVLHITYGYILCEKDSGGNYVFRNRFFSTLNQNEGAYYKALYEHIDRHLLGLGIGG